MAKASYVYIFASGRYGTLYTGVTSDLVKRTWQHKEGFTGGFAKKYRVKQLVWYEVHDDIKAAITREKANQEMEPRLEDQVNSGAESAMAGFVCGSGRVAVL